MILHIFVHISLLQALPPQEPFLFLSVLCSSSMEESDHQKQLQGWKKSSSESRTTDRASTQLSSRSSGVDEVNLAAIAIGLNVTLRSSQMPAQMQEGAFRCARSFLDSSDPNNNNPKPHRPNPSLLARALKKEFDCEYGPAWHCVVGKSFGSFVTHSPGGFLYFSIDSLSVLLFKTEVKLVTE